MLSLTERYSVNRVVCILFLFIGLKDTGTHDHDYYIRVTVTNKAQLVQILEHKVSYYIVNRTVSLI